MIVGLEFLRPTALALLPLALLPLLPLLPWPRLGGDERVVPSTAWLPRDPRGTLVEWLWRALGAATVAATVVALAGPARAESRVERVGRGAEIAILLDRSSSMDAKIRPPPPVPGLPPPPTMTKNAVVREALEPLLAERSESRYALILFNAAPMRVAPFGDDAAVAQAALDASAIGRGPSETEMGRALLAAIEAFEGRPYGGSRAILLVSDGGARLDAATRRAIRRGLAEQRAALYFVYVRSSPNSPNLETVGTSRDVAAADAELEEIELHLFFESLESGYAVFEAEDPASMNAAIARIDEEQDQPLVWYERVPRVDLVRPWTLAACLGSLGLLALSALRRGAVA